MTLNFFTCEKGSFLLLSRVVLKIRKCLGVTVAQRLKGLVLSSTIRVLSPEHTYIHGMWAWSRLAGLAVEPILQRYRRGIWNKHIGQTTYTGELWVQ